MYDGKAPTLQNGQTHSNNSSALSTNCLSVFDHFVELALKCLAWQLVSGLCNSVDHSVLFYLF